MQKRNSATDFFFVFRNLEDSHLSAQHWMADSVCNNYVLFISIPFNMLNQNTADSSLHNLLMIQRKW